MTRSEPCEVVIASYIEPDLAERIAAAEPRAHVVYEPSLLPPPRYPADHHGDPRTLDDGELQRWEAVVERAEVMFDFDWRSPETIPERCPHLRLIQATSAGVGSVMTRTGLDRSEIEVCTAAGTHAVPLAEFALLGALYFVKGMPTLTAWKARHHWELYATHQLAGRRALVVGLGGIGRRVAESFAALGVEVWGLARRTPPELPAGVTRMITQEEMPGVLPDVDVLVVASPLTEKTHHMVGAAELAALPAHAIVVNIGRGPVIDEPALIGALTEGRLAGACLDVFETEPLPEDSPLWQLDNVIISPHSASTLAEENEVLVDLFLDNLARYLDGRPRRNVYDRAAGY
ncbi:MAG TPA: D-2-hydroxyacid dehydrogenase [Solirubrobacteraceae bacterium]|nr:D-2-hydroxyacid dehydrogenase [Solirubrobacteraceae bacterium]